VPQAISPAAAQQAHQESPIDTLHFLVFRLSGFRRWFPDLFFESKPEG